MNQRDEDLAKKAKEEVKSLRSVQKKTSEQERTEKPAENRTAPLPTPTEAPGPSAEPKLGDPSIYDECIVKYNEEPLAFGIKGYPAPTVTVHTTGDDLRIVFPQYKFSGIVQPVGYRSCIVKSQDHYTISFSLKVAFPLGFVLKGTQSDDKSLSLLLSRAYPPKVDQQHE